MTKGNPPGRGTGFGRNPGDSSVPKELSLAVLECDEAEADANLAALTTLVGGAAGTMRVTEVTSTCLAINIDAPLPALARLKAALKLGGATLMPVAAEVDEICVILAIRPLSEQDSKPCG